MSQDSLETFPAGSERIGMASLSRRSLVYSLGGLAYKGVALLTIPLLARLLSPAALGLLDFAAVLASLIGLIAILGTDQAVAYHESRTESHAGLWGSALAITVSGAAAILIAAVVFQTPLAQTLTGDSANASAVVAAAVYGGVIGLSAMALNAVRLRGTPRAYAIASFLLITSEMAVALGIVWLVTEQVAFIVLGWAAGALVVLVPLLVRYLPTLARPQMATIRGLLAFGAPLAPVAIAWLVGDSWIRATLAREVELSALGEYGIAFRVASVLGLVVTGFGVAWYPYLYRSPRAEVIPRASEALGKLILALSGLAVALSLLAPEIIAVVAGSAYSGARHAVPALVGGMLGLGVFMLISAVIGTAGSTRRIALAGASGAAVQIAASQPLVSAFGLAGAALTSLAGYTFAAALLAGTESRVVAGTSGMKSGIAVVIAVAGLAAAAWLSGSPFVIRMLWLAAFSALVMTAASLVFGVSVLGWVRGRRTVGMR